MKNTCNKCGCSQLFVEIQGKRRGLYCTSCGQWQKWITKEELQVAKARGCRIEYQVAREYGVKILYEDFFINKLELGTRTL